MLICKKKKTDTNRATLAVLNTLVIAQIIVMIHGPRGGGGYSDIFIYT